MSDAPTIQEQLQQALSAFNAQPEHDHPHTDPNDFCILVADCPRCEAWDELLGALLEDPVAVEALLRDRLRSPEEKALRKRALGMIDEWMHSPSDGSAAQGWAYEILEVCRQALESQEPLKVKKAERMADPASTGK